MFCIFDLDGTVIDSSHRKLAKPDGSLDLEHWIDNCTPEKIAADSLLPLVSLMRKNWRGGHTVLVCTARVLSDADYMYFLENDIPYHVMLSRPNGCTMADHTLKDIQLRLYAQSINLSWKAFCEDSILYDDNVAILSHLESIGMNTKDAIYYNRVLGA